jgi:hypothetical protein
LSKKNNFGERRFYNTVSTGFKKEFDVLEMELCKKPVFIMS